MSTNREVCSVMLICFPFHAVCMVGREGGIAFMLSIHVIHKHEIVGSIWMGCGRKFMSVRCRRKKMSCWSINLQILKTQSTLLLMKLTSAWSTQTWTHGIPLGDIKEKHLGKLFSIHFMQRLENFKGNKQSFTWYKKCKTLPISNENKVFAFHKKGNPQISNMLPRQDALLL